MTWYIIILIFMILPMAFACLGYKRHLDTSKLVIPLSLSVLMFFMCFRSIHVGADTAQYVYGFRQICNTDLKNLFDLRVIGLGGGYELNFEYGYRVFNKLVSFFSTNDQAIIIANSLIIILLLGKLIYKKSDYVFLSIWLYITLGVFQTQMNMSRNAIAILLCYCGLEYIEERKLNRFIFYVLLASLFHSSAILFIPFYWIIPNVELKPRRVGTLLGIAVILGFCFSIVRPYFIKYLPFGFGVYFIENTSKLESLVVGALHLLLMVYVWIMIDKSKKEEVVKAERIGIWMFVSNIFFFCVGYDVSAASRMAALFGPYLIILLPNMIKKGTDSNNKRFLIIVLLIILTGIQYVLRLRINNIGTTMPYQFWEGLMQ